MRVSTRSRGRCRRSQRVLMDRTHRTAADGLGASWPLLPLAAEEVSLGVDLAVPPSMAKGRRPPGTSVQTVKSDLGRAPLMGSSSAVFSTKFTWLSSVSSS